MRLSEARGGMTGDSESNRKRPKRVLRSITISFGVLQFRSKYCERGSESAQVGLGRTSRGRREALEGKVRGHLSKLDPAERGRREGGRISSDRPGPGRVRGRLASGSSGRGQGPLRPPGESGGNSSGPTLRCRRARLRKAEPAGPRAQAFPIFGLWRGRSRVPKPLIVPDSKPPSLKF